jgi:hypothetical protein
VLSLFPVESFWDVLRRHAGEVGTFRYGHGCSQGRKTCSKLKVAVNKSMMQTASWIICETCRKIFTGGKLRLVHVRRRVLYEIRAVECGSTDKQGLPSMPWSMPEGTGRRWKWWTSPLFWKKSKLLTLPATRGGSRSAAGTVPK